MVLFTWPVASALAVALILAVGLAAWWRLRPSRPPDQPVVRVDIDLGPDADQLGGDPVIFTGRDAGVNALPQFGQDLDHHAIRYTHESDFLRRLEKNHDWCVACAVFSVAMIR